MPVTEIEIRRQVRRLLVVFNSSKPEDQLVEGWKWVLGEDVEYEELMAAVSDYAKSDGKYFPTPGQVRTAALAKRAPNQYTECEGNGHDPALSCETCGAEIRELSPDEQVWFEWDDSADQYVNVLPPAQRPRFGILHDYRRHRERGDRIVGGYRR